MEALLAHLETVVGQTRAQVGAALGAGQVINASDEHVTAALALAAELSRLADAVLVEATGEIARRSTARDRDLRLTTRMGCRDVSELVQRLTRLGPGSAARLQKAGRSTMVGICFAGTPMPARLPAMRDALLDGTVGVDGLLAVAGPLDAMSRRVGMEDLLAADTVLAAEARGEGPDAAPAACAELLRLQALVWSAVLDPDGAEPREDRALRLRGITIGATRDGLIPIRGMLLPEVAAQFRRICDATGSPRVDGSVQFRPDGETPSSDPDSDDVVPDDPRTWPQRQHDALATALFTAASSGLLPTIGGAAPTLIVSVREEDLTAGTGWAHVDGTDEPVTLTAATHAGCAGVIQRILLDPGGRIVRLGTEERVFNRRQRRAIALRDGGCLIPGCHIPPGWCEIHHVTDHAHGGPTHTDNGVLLCWFHHRFLDKTGWRIRMNRGVPEVKALEWIDPTGRWRTATKSKTRMLDHIKRKT